MSFKKREYISEETTITADNLNEIQDELIRIGDSIGKSGARASVLDFGAVGDGITDDTLAIQTALDAGGDVYFPAGRYKVTSQLTASKPCTISMFKQYPSNAYDDYPKTADDNWMGARIETYSSTNGIVIGDGVNLDGFYIRAMTGFGSKANASTYGGRGVILQYDGSVGHWTYPSSVRLAHIRVDIDFKQNAEMHAVIPECLFDFKPSESYHYILDDIILGQHNGMKYCDFAFRADVDNTPEKWAHNIFVRNMCIDSHCDYGVYLTGDGNGWMFEGLTIQAYGYVPGHESNIQNRKGHRALIKMSDLKDVGFYSCYLWDTGGTANYPAYYSDGGEIVVDGTSDSTVIKNSTTIISCVGCSNHFDVCETYIYKKLNAPDNLNIKNLEMSVISDGNTGANVLTLSDGSYLKSASIPAAAISDTQIGNAVSIWMDDAVIPKKITGKNKFDANKNGVYGVHTAFDDYNLIGYVYTNSNNGDAYYDDATRMWTTHLIAAEYGDVIRLSKNGVMAQGYLMSCYDADLKWLGHYEIWAGASGQPETIDYAKPHVAIKDTAYIRIAFMRDTQIVYPTDENFPNLCITVNNPNITYEPYEEKYEAKLNAMLPKVTESDNGKILKVVNGEWVAATP